MTFGAPGKGGSRVHDIKDVEAILDIFRSHGHTEVRPIDRLTNLSWFATQWMPCLFQIDTSRVYSEGTCEEYLGKIDLASKGLKLETKIYPIGVITYVFRFTRFVWLIFTQKAQYKPNDPIVHNAQVCNKHPYTNIAHSNWLLWLLGPSKTSPTFIGRS